VRAGARIGGWEVSVFAKNLTDSHLVLYDRRWVTSNSRIMQGTCEPRSIGVTATYQY